MGASKQAWGLTKYEVVIQINPNKHVMYTTMGVRVVVTHVTSYDVLVGMIILYLGLLGINYPLLTKMVDMR
jgi:hypothetical protein